MTDEQIKAAGKTIAANVLARIAKIETAPSTIDVQFVAEMAGEQFIETMLSVQPRLDQGDRARAVLREIQWDVDGECPVCRRDRSEQHALDCKLAEAIR